VVDAAARELVVVCLIARWADREPPRDRIFSEQRTTTQPATRPSTITGDVRRHEVESPQLGNTRTVVVWLPPDYAASRATRYPVLYMHDGQNVFDAATSFLGVEWRADETAAQLIREQKIEPLIIVGIYNTPARAAEYSPFPQAGRNAGGDGDKYLAFLVETVKPLIDTTYRTKPERENTALAGSSLGGLISMYAICRHPDVFGKAGVISPALWFGDRGTIAYAREHPPRPDARIWIDVGTEEGDMKALYVSHARELVDLLESQGRERGREMEYLEVEGAIHHEQAWADRLDRALVFLFPRAAQ
jgi:predicted alpha/beta superfamily hydrolase